MRGCLTCRLRHLKCDKSGSKCLRCQRSGRECVPAPGKSEEISFRHGQNPSLRKGPPRYGESDLAFPDDQVWVETSSSFHFKDETDQTAAEYYVVPVTRQASTSRSSSENSTPPSTMDYSLATPTLVLPAFAGSQLGSRSNSGNSSRATTTPTPIGHPRLSNVTEAFLLRHFQKYLAPWLDAFNPDRHFSTDVIERATQSPLLLYACLAVSACHLSRTTNSIAGDVAHGYHERCISIMLPVLDKPEFEIGIDILLSSTVILRFFESISSHSPPNDQQHHLLAGSVYISSHVDSAISGGLASASFWAYVIQDIQFALTYQKCLRLTFAPFDDRLRRWWAAKPALSDGDWTNRAIWLLAETIDFCYNISGRSHDGRLGSAGEAALRHRILEWELGRPDTFVPLHISPADPGNGKPFPVAWYTSLWHATAVQHICLTKSLVLIRELEFYDRSMLHLEQPVKLRHDLAETLNFMFGIATSADDDPSLRITACHALFACGSWVEDPVVQTLLIDLLRRTERENGWPWGYMRNQVMQAWRPI
ncbi:Zn(2)-C6 fungal-type DNA-binding domain [Penicillium roqueforti FM164]|uniref:Zn(2)-C6 fungal-type DNA-binding domain n=2 Tax=Penicillium roqueforti TaxID=5082 RepID=W6QMQ8_PENRF|nr:Zn(2)-C6 fungal-type DNA-binding domain [Penicillium roqueforti FM164]